MIIVKKSSYKKVNFYYSFFSILQTILKEFVKMIDHQINTRVSRCFFSVDLEVIRYRRVLCRSIIDEIHYDIKFVRLRAQSSLKLIFVDEVTLILVLNKVYVFKSCVSLERS